ncbi:MAG: hypothetical protein AAGJ56_08470, partial [Myxococcota bacterium]
DAGNRHTGFSVAHRRHAHRENTPRYHHDLNGLPRRMVEVLEQLSAFEGLSPTALLNNLSLPVGDIVSVGVSSELTAAGTIPLPEALRLRNGIKGLILAAAHSTLEPEPFFPRLSRAEAVELLNSVREGQPERGSFRARVIVPVDPDVGPLSLEPFSRRVVRTLMCALDAVHRVRSLGGYDDLLTMVKLGVSANLLSALAGMRFEDKGRWNAVKRWSNMGSARAVWI